LIADHGRIEIIDYGVGHVTETDMLNSEKTGAVIFGFDVPCTPVVGSGALPGGACVRLYSVIYDFLDGLKAFIHDA
jgi:translation initiation factor IF-2